MYPQQVINSCYSAKNSSLYIIPADIAYFLRAHSLRLPCFLLYTFRHRNYVLTKIQGLWKMFAAIIFVRCKIFKIWTLNYLETLVIPHEIRTSK